MGLPGYAWQSPLDDGGRQIVLAIDRPWISFREQANKPRSVNSPFTILEIRLNREDQGDGKIHSGAKVFLDKKDNIAVENYARSFASTTSRRRSDRSLHADAQRIRQRFERIGLQEQLEFAVRHLTD